jgi:tellurite resistance protein
MTDEVVLDKLVALGVTGDTVVALSLCPLIHVAWADGEIQDNERDAILQAAKGKGIDEGDPAFELLAKWLKTKEPNELWTAWSTYVGALREEMTSEQFGLLRTQIVNFATAVAQAAGGFLGIKSISQAEQDAIAEVDAVFDA